MANQATIQLFTRQEPDQADYIRGLIGIFAIYCATVGGGMILQVLTGSQPPLMLLLGATALILAYGFLSWIIQDLQLSQAQERFAGDPQRYGSPATSPEKMEHP